MWWGRGATPPSGAPRVAIARAGAAYWAIVFALGFLLGTVRVLWLEPAIGTLPAVLAEMPVMLVASWLSARWLLERFAIVRARAALAMGVLAFAMLMGSEVLFAIVLPGNSPQQWMAGMATTAGLMGLCGQVLFGLLPWLIRSRPRAGGRR